MKPATPEEIENAIAAAEGSVWDFGGVMTRAPFKLWETTVYPFCEARGLSRERVMAGFDTWRKVYDSGAIDFYEMYRRIFAEAGLNVADEDLTELREYDLSSWVAEKRADTLELMTRAKAAGKKVAILTNMTTDFYEEFFVPGCAEFRALADVEVVSQKVGVSKPDPRIYAIVEERLALPPEKLVFFDDTQVNVNGAIACGWNALLYA